MALLSKRTISRVHSCVLVGVGAVHAAGAVTDEERDRVVAELADGPDRLLAAMESGTLGLAGAVNASGLHVLAALLDKDGKVTVPLCDIDAAGLGCTDSEIAALAEFADKHGLVDIDVPDDPEGLDDEGSDNPEGGD
jgi:hypothetical protein